MAARSQLVIAVALLSLSAALSCSTVAADGASGRSEQGGRRPEPTPAETARGQSSIGGFVAGEEARETPEPLIYAVDRSVAEFPEKQDLSTPEAAYATFIPALVTGDPARWGELCERGLRTRLLVSPPQTYEMPPDRAQAYLNARILEVQVLQGTYAQVIAKLPEGVKGRRFPKRSFVLEDGKWLNEGAGSFETLDDARKDCRRLFARRLSEPVREEPIQAKRRPVEKIEDPDACLKRFTEFLKARGEDPKPFVMRALTEHRLVIMGEVHHRPLYWAFNASLVADPVFAERVGTIYMELPSNDQALVDKFLAAEELNVAPVIAMLRDMLWMGWPDQAMLDFFTAVWTANRKLPRDKRLRIVLADMQRPWKEIHERGDWAAHNVNRDDFMAHKVMEDLRRHPDEERNAFFIVGVGHAMLGLTRPAAGGAGESAGSRLQYALGTGQVYAIFPHQAVGTNAGEVYGRLQRGLFESAFAELQNKPVAFPLHVGPFGEQPFDGLPDHGLSGTYRDGYSAYLYLGPLEDEIFSPLIPGFYTDEFVQEIGRRTRIMDGKAWSETYGREPSAASFITWMSGSWGMPRRKWRDGLGPIDAWRNPEQAVSAEAASHIRSGSQQELIALVEHYFRHNARDLTTRKSTAWGEVETDTDGNYSIRYTFYGTIWDGEALLFDAVFTFSPTGEVLSLEKRDVRGTAEALKALVEDYLLHNGEDVAARKPIDWGEAEKHADGSYSIRHRYQATTKEGGTLELNRVFTFDRAGDIMHITDAPSPPAGRAHGTDDDTKAGG